MPRSNVATMALPAAMVGIVIMMVIPVPSVLLDLLLSLNIAAAVLILLASLNVRRALDLASFPSLLLVATLFRLGLNVSTTRLILGDGEAGDVISAFGRFVIGGSVVVGLVVFLILVVIQFVVITNGATRVAEVGARFTLDAMPGKQMAIDADLNAGIIDDEEATRRRSEISAEADFYGAMDGASKFVKGDAIAGIVITVINLVGGLVIGVIQQGMSIGEAGSTYSLLTVGDGLVSQIPALLISISSGIIVTRATGTSDLGTDVANEFARQSRPFMIGGGVVAGLGVMPGLPLVPFALVGSASIFIGYRLNQPTVVEIDEEPEEVEPVIDPDDPAHLRRAMRVEAIGLEVAADMVDLVDPSRGGDLLDRVRALRRKIALELGLVMPAIRTRDNIELPSGSYAILLHGVELARGIAPPERMLVIADDLDLFPGEVVNEPVFGLPAKWVPEAQATHAETLGATVVDRASVMTTHLAEVARTHAAELIGRQDVKGLLDLVRESDPAVVDDLGTNDVSLPQVQWVLQELLREQVPIRDMVRILEVIGERARHVQSSEDLVEAVREVLAPAITERHSRGGELSVITLDPILERDLSMALGPEAANSRIDAMGLQTVVSQIQDLTLRAETDGHEPVVVCSPTLRRPLLRLMAGVNGIPPIHSFRELGPQVELVTVGTVADPTASPAGGSTT